MSANDDRLPDGPAAAPQAPQPVVHINVRGDTRGLPHEVGFIIDSIFAAAEFATLRAELVAHIVPLQPQSHTDVVAHVTAFLGARRAADPSAGAVLDRAATRLQEHMREALEAGSAYLSRKRNLRQVFWPKLADQPTADLMVKRRPLFGRDTPIASAGSCFATNIRNALHQLGYNYLITESNEVASAAWGLIFNTVAFRQLVEFAFGERERPRVIFPVTVNHAYTGTDPNRPVYMDPIREGIVFQDLDDYDASCERHRAHCRKAFEDCELFIFTLGMSEVWEYKIDGSAMAWEPKAVPTFLVNKRVLTAAENVAELERAFALLTQHNPKLKLVLTVSPVALHATFRGDDMHVITANSYSKSALRAAADEMVSRHPDRIIYFPSYEKIMYATADAWEEDGRHPNKDAIVSVIELFLRCHLNDDEFGKIGIQTEPAKKPE
jgi:hypothetical protein